MKLYFGTQYDRKEVATVSGATQAMIFIQKYCQQIGYETHYIRTIDIKGEYTQFDFGSQNYFFWLKE